MKKNTILFIECLLCFLLCSIHSIAKDNGEKTMLKYAGKQAAQMEKEGWRTFDKDSSLVEQLQDYRERLNAKEGEDAMYIISSGHSDTCATLEEAKLIATERAMFDLYCQTYYEGETQRIESEDKVIFRNNGWCMGELLFEREMVNRKKASGSIYWDAIRRTCLKLPYIRDAKYCVKIYREVPSGFLSKVYMYARVKGYCEKIGSLYYYLNLEKKTAEIVYHKDYTELDNVKIPTIVSYEGTTYNVTGICENAFYHGSNISEIRYPKWLDLSKAKVPSTAQLINYDPRPPLLAMENGSLSFTDATKNNCIDAEEKCLISFSITNKGKGDAENCEAVVKMSGSTSGIKTARIPIPQIAVGQTCEVKIPITSDFNTQDGTVIFSIEVVEPGGWGVAPFDLAVATKAYEPPLVQVVDYSVASNSGKISKMDPFTLTFNLQNTKYGDAEDVKVKINIPKENIYLIDGETELLFPIIKSGEVKKINISLVANNNYAVEQIPISIDVKEKHGKYAEDKAISLALNKPTRSSITIEEKVEKPKEIQLAMMSSDIDRDIPTSPRQNESTLVLIVANENYQSMPNVPYAINDGNVFKEYCNKTLGIPQENIMYQSDATLNGFRQKVALLHKKVMARFAAGKETHIIFYYTGHGMPDVNTQSAYLMPVDGFDENVSTGYKIDDLYQLLGQMPAEAVTVFLDACFSGVNRNDKALAVHKGARLTSKSGSPVGNMIVFAASQGNQTASVNDKEGHGLFTYYLLKKLKATQGEVSLNELANYLTAEVNMKSLDLFEKEQIPSVVASPQVENQWQSWKLK